MTAATKKEFETDKGYAWIILLCAFLARTIDCLMVVTAGIFILEYIEYFHVDKAFLITGLISGYFIAMAIAGVAGGFAIDRFGVRPVMTFGVTLCVVMLLVLGTFPSLAVLGICYTLLGCGFQISSQGVIVIVQLYFNKRRSFASGVMTSGMSCGIFIWAPFFRFLIDTYTWRGALYVIAGVVMQTYILICLMRPPPTMSKKSKDIDYTKAPEHETDEKIVVEKLPENENVKTTEELNLEKLETNGCMKDVAKPKKPSKKFQYFIWVLYTLCLTLQFIGHFVPMSYYPMKGKLDGISKDKVPILLSVIGAMGLISRAPTGYITDRFINRINLAVGSLIVCGGLLIVTTFFHTFVPLLIICVSIGIIQSFYMATLSAMWVDVYGIEHIAVGSGLGSGAIGLAIFILHPIAGVLLDLTGGTAAIFLVFGGIQIFSGFLLLFVKLLMKYEDKNTPGGKTSKQEEKNIALSTASLVT